MNQVAVFNSARYIKLFIVAVLLVSITATVVAFGGVKWPTTQKPLTCNDVVLLHHIGEWDIATNPNGQTVKMDTISAWNETSQTVRRSLVVKCAK